MFATKIEEVVGDFVTLKRQGSGYVGICPFHNDRNPSMHVNPRLGIYKCFVCDAKGNAIHFLMEHDKKSYPEALEYLAKKYSIPIEYDRQESDEEKRARNEKESLYLVNEFAEKYFMQQMREDEEGKMMGMSYFKERGFKEVTLEKFHLGYCPDRWDAFTTEALKQGYKEEFLLALGLTRKSSSGKLYDFFRGRVIFPIHNTTGRCIGFGGRVIKKEKEEKIAKYFNSPESKIYNKSDTLYDIYLAKSAIRKEDNLFLVEGYTDVISMFEAGVENVVASSGTALTENQVRTIRALTKNITVLYDGDPAGIKASLRGIDMLLEKGMNVRVCLLPDGEDPDSFAKKNRDQKLREFLETNTTDFILFKSRILSEEAGNDPIKRAEVVHDILQSITKVQDPIVQQFYIKECARIFEISEESLGGRIRSLTWKNYKTKAGEAAKSSLPEVGEPTLVTKPPIPKEQVNLLYEAEKNIVILLIKYGLYEIFVKSDDEEEVTQQRVDQYVVNELYREGIVLQDPLLQKIYNHYLQVAEVIYDKEDLQHTFFYSEDEAEYNFAIENLSNEVISYSPKWEERFDLQTRYADNNIQNLQQMVQDALLTLKLRLVEQQKAFLNREMKNEEYSEEERTQILTQINLLNKTRKEISVQLNRVVSGN